MVDKHTFKQIPSLKRHIITPNYHEAMSRKRYVELTQITNDLLNFLDKKEVKKEERCVVKGIAEDMINRCD